MKKDLTNGNRSIYDADDLIFRNLLAWENTTDRFPEVFEDCKKWYEAATGETYSLKNLEKRLKQRAEYDNEIDSIYRIDEIKKESDGYADQILILDGEIGMLMRHYEETQSEGTKETIESLQAARDNYYKQINELEKEKDQIIKAVFDGMTDEEARCQVNDLLYINGLSEEGKE